MNRADNSPSLAQANARRHQAALAAAHRATADSLRQRLDAARAENTRLRAENRSLRDQLARQLGLQRSHHPNDARTEPR